MKSKDEIRGIYLIERTAQTVKTEKADPRRYYVGQALDIFNRLNQHCFAKNPGIDEAIRNLGVKSFSFRILEIVKNDKDLDSCESKWIALYRQQYGDEQMYNIAQTSNASHRLDSKTKRQIEELFREDIGRSIYAIAEHFDISYEKVIDIRKPLLRKLNLKWKRGKIVDATTGKEADNWRGYQFTEKMVDIINEILDDENKTEKDIRFVSSSDLQIFLNSREHYSCAPPLVENTVC